MQHESPRQCFCISYGEPKSLRKWGLLTHNKVLPILPWSLRSRARLESDTSIGRWSAYLVAVYWLSSLVFTPVAYWIAKHCFPKRVLFAYLLVANAVSALSFYLGRSVAALLAVRALQGMLSSTTWTASLVTLAHHENGQDFACAINLCFFAYRLGFIFAPFFGGLVFEKSGLGATSLLVFGMVAPVLVFQLLVSDPERRASESRDRRRQYWRSSYNDRGIPVITAASAVSPLEDFESWLEIRHPHASPPLAIGQQWSSLVRIRHFKVTLLAIFFEVFITAVFDVALPQYVQKTFKWSALRVGTIYIPFYLPTLYPACFKRVQRRLTTRSIVLIGYVVEAPLLVLLRLIDHEARAPFLCLLLFLIGVASTWVLRALMVEIATTADQEIRNQGALFYPSEYQEFSWVIDLVTVSAGALVGTLAGGILMQSAGWAITTLALGVSSAGAAVVFALIIDLRPHRGALSVEQTT